MASRALDRNARHGAIGTNVSNEDSRAREVLHARFRWNVRSWAQTANFLAPGGKPGRKSSANDAAYEMITLAATMMRWTSI